MRMIWGPTKWSCMPTCLAMLLDVSVEQVYQWIGHDGSQIINDDPEPYCRKGFEWQEIVKAALSQGLALVEYPDVLPIRGILLGTSDNDVPHACAWDGKGIFDPARGRRRLDSFRYDAFYVAFSIGEKDREEFCQTQCS